MHGLQWPDWIVIFGYSLFMVCLGIYYSRRQKTTEDFFLAGRRTGSFVAGISLFATLLSTITYLSMPGELIQHGPIFMLGCAAVLLTYPIVGYVLIPAVMRVPVTSAYELLEHRLGHNVRMLGSAIFMATRIIWMALLIFLSSKTFVVMMGWKPIMIIAVIWVLGLVAIIYTMLGGLRAVMITDVIQTAILLGGLLLTIGFITAHLDGPGAWWPTTWASHWDEQPLLSFSPTVRVTVFGSVLYTVLFWSCASISDQVTIQRYLSTRDVRTARRAFFITSITDVLASITLALVGFALLGFFHHHPELIPVGASLSGDADFLFPYYISNFLPVGIAGLIVSAILAAAMSSLDSGLNSVTAVLSTDWLDAFGKSCRSETNRLRLARRLTLVIGIAVLVLACSMDYVPGNILEVLNKTVGLFFAPMAGLFFMALFVRGANGIGAVTGAAFGFITAILIAYWDILTGGPTLSFQWIIPSALVVQLLVGCLVSRLSQLR